MKSIRAWAWSEGVSNFGDELGISVLSRLGYDVERVPEMQDAEVLSAGSLIESASVNAAPGATIWGSGLMHGSPTSTSGLNVAVVRGRLTARAIGMPDLPTGDPGSLVPHLWGRPKARWGLGVVRHYVDDDPYPGVDVVIDASWPVDEVIDAIGSCRSIASSSLHGIIVASSWGIPTMRIPHDGVAGGNFKWIDWMSGTQDGSELLRNLP